MHGLQRDEEGVDITFENATPRRFAFVVGADGLHSVVRSLAFGPESDYLRSIDCYTAWFTTPAGGDLDGWFLMFNAPGGLVVSVRPGRLPGENKAGLSFRSAPIAYDRRNTSEQKEIMTQRFAGLGWETPSLLKSMHTASDFFFDSMGQVRMDSWSRGRVALLGDAGYCPTPLTGLGTSFAPGWAPVSRSSAHTYSRANWQRPEVITASRSPATTRSCGRMSPTDSSCHPAASAATHRTAHSPSACAPCQCAR